MRVIVVGAGILGASAAWHLACAGAEVVVVDDARAGRATSAGAGIVCPWVTGNTDPVFYALHAAAGAYYGELIAALAAEGETDVGFARCGTLCVSADAAGLDGIERLVRARCDGVAEAGELRRLPPREAQALFRPLREDFGAVQVTGGMRVDGRLLAAALLRAARARGAGRLEGAAELVAGHGRVRGVRIGLDTREADAVVVATGAWAPAMLAPLGVRLDVVPVRGQIAHLRLTGARTEDWPVILPPGDHYLLTFGDGRVVVGATREWQAGFDVRLTAAGVEEVLREALSVAPGLADATLLGVRVGLRPAAPDGRALLGAVPGWDGLYLGNGLSAFGLTQGPFAGRLLAELVLGRNPALDLTPFSPGR
jgi:D-amino-acid dehydrogenase